MTVFFKRLYVRIWLAVVLAVAMLTFLVGWAWRMTAEPPLRDVVVRNANGDIIGSGHGRFVRSRGNPESPNNADAADPPADPEPPDDAAEARHFTIESNDPTRTLRGRYGNGPEYMVRLADGQLIHLHLPRPAPSFWGRAPFGFFWTLSLVAIAVALATYPIVRKLTLRLERLQLGVAQWGAGDLSVRVPVSGQDEVAFLAAQFNEAAQRIQGLVTSQGAVLASQKSLLANASHELRSPLARIRMGLELLAVPVTDAHRKEISRNIAELDSLIEEILLASRLDAQEADMGTIESVDLIGLAAEESARVDAVLDVCLPPPHSTEHLDTPGLQTSLAVQGVAKLLRRVMRNLLENARRHAKGDITVTLCKADSYAEIRVRDHGPGVPPELQERIFEPFYRLPGATERDGGVGLGLALVKSITERHHGTVRCENHPQGGACFIVQLPLSHGPSPSP